MMASWQEWAVALLLLLCVGRIGKGLCSFFSRAGKKNNPCETCVSGCELKSIYDRKRTGCDKEYKKKKKKCCR